MCTAAHICGERRKANVFCLHQTVYQSTYIYRRNEIELYFVRINGIGNFDEFRVVRDCFDRSHCNLFVSSALLFIADGCIEFHFKFFGGTCHCRTESHVYEMTAVCLSISFINFCMLAQRSKPSSSCSLLEFVNSFPGTLWMARR